MNRKGTSLLVNSGARGAPWVNKSGSLSLRDILVVASAYAHPPFRLYRLWGRGRGALRQPDGGGECYLFLAGNSAVLFWQPVFFLAGNRMTIVAFKKEVSLKS